MLRAPRQSPRGAARTSGLAFRAVAPNDRPDPCQDGHRREGQPNEEVTREAGSARTLGVSHSWLASLSYHLCYHCPVAQREKRSISLPPDLTRRIAEEAARKGTTFSAWIAEAAAKQLKLEAGRRAVEEWERENGAFTPEELAEADRRLDRLLRPPRRARRSA